MRWCCRWALSGVRGGNALGGAPRRSAAPGPSGSVFRRSRGSLPAAGPLARPDQAPSCYSACVVPHQMLQRNSHCEAYQ